MSIFRIVIHFSGLLGALFLFDFGYGAPAGRNLPSMEVPPPKLINFMRRFGYLEPNPSDSEALYHEVAIIEAIRNIQKYGAINQTGELDRPTLQLLSSPRCGVPDIESQSRSRSKRYIIGARSWQKRKIRYYIANWSAKMQRDQIERDLEKAFNMWSRYNRLKFQRVDDTSADIIVGFGSSYHGDNYPFDGPGNILAHAFYPYEMGSYGGDIHFDEDENWVENSTNLSDGVDFYSVALHELGHSLGLAHSPVYSSIMFPYYKGPGQNVLDYDDVLAMYDLYVQRKLPGDDDKLETYTPRSRSTSTTPSQFEETTEITLEVSTTTREDIQFTYEGDFETVGNHKKKYSTNMIWISTGATTKIPKKIRPIAPGSHICQGHFDAVSLIKGSIYIFKGKYVWRVTPRYTIDSDYPKPIYEMLPFLPENTQSIDAVYERFDGASVYFTGKIYWIYDGQGLIENSPRNLTDFISTATNVTKIDAAMVWRS
ncbi:matrix metalloproteinase-2-like isoform X2 [Eupeodes corollae]|uniref:matrix metalloproteinase-2-like isoform X2 n=1 Tax=Eupeodes corollae TaxID=290404 RepID=UPI002492C977|nr:matrix metalloproteinase-2-like isoform X2 [Eupeodes corollae]